MSQRQWIWKFAIVAVLVSVALTSANAARKKSALPWKSWVAENGRDHILAGRIWSTKLGFFMNPDELADALAPNDFILLGEVHDNPDHHKLQAWLMRKIAGHDRRPAVVMEMIGRDQEKAVTDYISSYKAPIAKLGTAIGWAKRGWPDWKTYAPIARVVYAYRLKMVAGNGSKETIKAIGKGGYDALEPGEAKRMGLGKPHDPKQETALLDELKASHCSMAPAHVLAPMGKVQHFRDALMADQMLKAGEISGAYLIAGNGHVRTDRGAPYYLRARDPAMLSASLMFIEVRPDAAYAEDLVPTGADGKPAADYFWFTPRVERPDPCEKLKKLFGKARKTVDEAKK